MTTLAQFRQRMLQLDPDLGRVENIASLNSDGFAAVVTRLAVGSIGSGKFADQWLLRPEAASQPADRLRFIDDYNSRTGELFHEGTAYSDVTATDEEVEIHTLEPGGLDEAIQFALRNTRFRDEHVIAARADGRYYLHDLAWLDEPSDILRVGRRANPVLTPNRHFEKWFGYDSGGLLVPDRWTLAGSGATFVRSTIARRGQFSLGVTAGGGASATVSFTVGLLDTGVSADTLRGQTVTGVLVLSSDDAGTTVSVTDDVDTTSSSFNTGDGTWEELTAQHVINAAATTLTLKALVSPADVIKLQELYLAFGSLNDDIRRDAHRTAWEDARPRYEQLSPLLLNSFRGRGGQVVIETARPYPEFTASRVLAGTADADEHDAPLDLIAYGALARLYEQRAHFSFEDSAKARTFADDYGARRDNHLYVEDNTRPGFTDEMLGHSSHVSARVGR